MTELIEEMRGRSNSAEVDRRRRAECRVEREAVKRIFRVLSLQIEYDKLSGAA